MALFDFLKDIGNYETRKVSRDDVAGLTVSTAFTSDAGYETAILDKNGVHPVERYESQGLAVLGHAKWCESAKTIDVIYELGLPGFEDIMNKETKLERDL